MLLPWVYRCRTPHTWAHAGTGFRVASSLFSSDCWILWHQQLCGPWALWRILSGCKKCWGSQQHPDVQKLGIRAGNADGQSQSYAHVTGGVTAGAWVGADASWTHTHSGEGQGSQQGPGPSVGWIAVSALVVLVYCDACWVLPWFHGGEHRWWSG